MTIIDHITPANANIFEELGLPDAANLKLRSQLMVEVRQYVEESGLTQVDAAKVLKTTQPRLNDVLKGKIDKCSIDRLVQMLAEAGRHVSITVSNAA
jgi:predicted XRE-type DNA-binding protein